MQEINNNFYRDLNERWYTSQGDAVALLRQEHSAKLHWVRGRLQDFNAAMPCRVLDVGCGGGFLSLELANDGHKVTALDVSKDVFAAGRSRDKDSAINWIEGTGEALPFTEKSFDVVCLMDLLEHVETPEKLIAEAARVLTPTGMMLLHTFNRTWASYFTAAKGLDWFIKDSPKNIHLWKMFITPKETTAMLNEHGFRDAKFWGLRPKLMSTALLRLLFTRRVPKDLSFVTCKDLQIGYLVSAKH